VLARQAADLLERNASTAALRESELRQAFFLKLSDTLRPLSDTTEIKVAACQLLGKQFGVNRVFYADAVNEHWVVTKGYEERIEPLPDGPFPMAVYGEWIIRDFRAGRRLIVRNMETDSRFTEAERAAQQALQINGALAVPLVKNGALVAMLALHDRAPRDWTQSEITLVEETAERTWEAVERARAEVARRESEARLAAAFESVPVGVAVIDARGSVVTANREFRRFLPNGLIPSRDSERGWRWRAWDPEGHPIDPQNFPGARAMRGERTLPGMEFIFTDDDGREIWTSVSTVPILEVSGRVVEHACVISDIDVLKRGLEAFPQRAGGAAFAANAF
jgi:PAS domain S-box-containing protein